MKRFLALVLALVMGLAMLTGCSDPVYDDFEKYLNEDMVDVNANYEKIKAEAATWADVEDTDELIKSVNDTLLPLVNDSLTKLDAINPATEEVKALKEKYVAVMNAYKEGFEIILDAIEANDVEMMEDGNAKLTEGIELLDEYNKAMEALAAEVGAEIEY